MEGRFLLVAYFISLVNTVNKSPFFCVRWQLYSIQRPSGSRDVTEKFSIGVSVYMGDFALAGFFGHRCGALAIVLFFFEPKIRLCSTIRNLWSRLWTIEN